MPRRRSVRALERLCLENVAGNMQRVWAKDYADNYLDEFHFRYIMGPFSELAGSLVQELLQLLGESRRLTRAMLHLLLVPHLTELSLSACPKLVSQAIAQLIVVRCKSLSLLDLQGCSRVPTDALVDLMEGLPHLTKLGLSETQCNTQVLSAVGSCCSQLRELDISDCKRLSPASLLHLAYDPTVGSFCCPMLQVLNVEGLKTSTHSQDMVAALAFLLLALPSLKFLVHELVAEAVGLIHHQQFGHALNAPGFPSLEKLVQCRTFTQGDVEGPRLLLQLQRVVEVEEPLLPVVCAVCPHLAEATILLRENSCLDWGLLSWHHLTHLTVNCMGQRALRELLPVTGCLGAQLHLLSLGGFSLEEEVSFPALLSQCRRLQKFSASLLPPQGHGRGREWGVEALNGDFNFTPHVVPQLRDLSLVLCSSEGPSHWAEVLKVSLVSLLRNSPHLEHLDLVCMPFSLDGVLQEVLRPPSTALTHLRELSLAQGRVSSHTIHLLLSLDNALTYLNLDGCPEIHQRDYDQLLRRISREGLELNIVWA
ncbi:uncharacterized protein [Tiliqua scincoides]|uniref:uncharacterized protein n=1 Tax=Tiliqua scincoides TaxID=71010 RepID=UPI003462FF8A